MKLTKVYRTDHDSFLILVNDVPIWGLEFESLHQARNVANGLDLAFTNVLDQEAQK